MNFLSKKTLFLLVFAFLVFVSLLVMNSNLFLNSIIRNDSFREPALVVAGFTEPIAYGIHIDRLPEIENKHVWNSLLSGILLETPIFENNALTYKIGIPIENKLFSVYLSQPAFIINEESMFFITYAQDSRVDNQGNKVFSSNSKLIPADQWMVELSNKAGSHIVFNMIVSDSSEELENYLYNTFTSNLGCDQNCQKFYEAPLVSNQSNYEIYNLILNQNQSFHNKNFAPLIDKTYIKL